MKNICLYFLIVCIAGYNTGLYELVKVPTFFMHYKEHRDLGTTHSLTDFIAMHYLGKDINDSDQKKDDALPFKHHSFSAQAGLFFIAEANVSSALYVQITIYRKKIPYRPFILPDRPAVALLRPPCC